MGKMKIVAIAVPLGGLRSDLRVIRVVWHRELIRFSRERMRAIAAVLQPIMNLFVFGTGMLVMTAGSGIDLRTFLFPGMVAMSVMFTALSSGGSVVIDREFGFMREMLVAPVSRSAIVIGKCLGGATTATFQGVLLLSLAGLVGVPYKPMLMLELLGESLLLAFALAAFGMLLAAHTKTMQAFIGIVQVFIMPLFFLSGATFPLGKLPTWLAVLTHANPLTYAIDPMRRAVLASVNVSPTTAQFLGPGVKWGSYVVPTWLELVIVALLSAVMLVIAIFQFRRTE